MKLELKHWAAYIPYGIPAILSQKGIFNQDDEYPNPKTQMLGIIKNISFWNPEITGQLHVTETYSFDFDDVDEVCICLHPLSDLTKSREVNGKTIFPIEYVSTSKKDSEYILLRVSKGLPLDVLEYWKIERLLELHFDIFGLIGAGLAVDINTVKF